MENEGLITESTTRSERKLLKRYAELRREEYNLITTLSDTLTRVDNLPAEQLEQVRDALFHADFPFLMVMVGPFSAGKSSIINALLGETVLDVGPVPTTDHIYILRHGEQVQRNRAGEITTIFHPNSMLENLSFVDTPGLESVFERHDSVTRSFLHRADLVILVMVATHVLSASNLDFLRELRDYGKRTIIVVNQIDVLDDADRQAVDDFVREQSRLHLGIEPTMWLISAKQALAAQAETPRDEILYDGSGFAEVEEYINETLHDAIRIKQKLETPLQIATHARERAAEIVSQNQVALDEHRKTLKNIEAQIDEGYKAQQRTVEGYIKEIEGHWQDATERGLSAIDELFHFSRAFRQVFAGIFEMLGVAAMLRRFGRQTRAQAAFDKHSVDTALNKIPEAVDRLGPRIEGQDIQDIDNLVDYTRQKIDILPDNLKSKVIGKVQAPMGYDRSFFRRIRPKLDEIQADGSRFETKNLDRILRNMVIVVALWQIVLILLTIIFALPSVSNPQTGLGVFALALLAALIGLGLLPLRGWLLKVAYRGRMQDLEGQYSVLVNEAANDMVDYGKQLRWDAVAPFTRLIESQSKLTRELQAELDDAEQAMLRIQRGLSTL